MKFELINNHIILSVETDRGVKDCIFDTGCPVSLFFDSPEWFCIDENRHALSHLNPMARVVNQHRPEIDELVGKKIDGIIGTDCLKSNNLLIDFPGSNLSISQKPLDTTFRVPMRNFFGLPIFEIYMNGVKINAAYDSGAMYSFVASTHLETLALTAQNKSYEDYNPILGQFTANLYTGDIRIGDKNLGSQNIAIGSAYDQSLQMVGIDAMIGTDALKQSIVGFSYIENRMGV